MDIDDKMERNGMEEWNGEKRGIDEEFFINSVQLSSKKYYHCPSQIKFQILLGNGQIQ